MIRDRLAALWGRLRLVPAAPAAPVSVRAPETLVDQLARADVSQDASLRQRVDGGRLYSDLSDARVAYLREAFPEEVSRTRAAAERICAHEFDLLGSGPYRPEDPHRSSRANGYRPIDWAIDPVSGLRFPEGFPHTAWNAQMRPGLADIKLPWELGRCQHWVTLGQAWHLSGDGRVQDPKHGSDTGKEERTCKKNRPRAHVLHLLTPGHGAKLPVFSASPG